MGLRRKYKLPAPLVREAVAASKTFLIVVEGACTERMYLEGLRDNLRLTSARVVVVQPGATDPENLVRYAIRKKDDQKALAEKTLSVPYDEVWVVFDSESPDHHRAKQIPNALQLAKMNGVDTAVSNPSFEFWLLLHFVFTTSAFISTDEVIAKLKQFIPKYSKNDVPITTLIERVANAVDGAKKCILHHKGCNGDGNPSTGVHTLVFSMNECASPSLRLQLDVSPRKSPGIPNKHKKQPSRRL